MSQRRVPLPGVGPPNRIAVGDVRNEVIDRIGIIRTDLIVRFEAKPRKVSLPGHFLCLTAMPFGLIIELGPFGFTFRYLGESYILGGEIQLSLHQLSFLSRGHGFSPEKCCLLLSPLKRPPKRRPAGDGEAYMQHILSSASQLR